MSDESEQIQAIRSRYKHSLSEKSEQISQYLNSIMDVEDFSDQIFTDLHEHLHKLAGSSGMYGYDDVASHSRQAMQQIVNNDEAGLTSNLLALRNLLKQYAKSN